MQLFTKRREINRCFFYGVLTGWTVAPDLVLYCRDQELQKIWK